MTTVTRQIHFARRTRRKVIRRGPPPEPPVPKGRIPRISKLMALAIRFERLLAEGKVANLAELARLAHVTQPRMTQIMNLLHLAPDIQEEILHLSPANNDRDGIHEKMTRPICTEIRWTLQRSMWRQATASQ